MIASALCVGVIGAYHSGIGGVSQFDLRYDCLHIQRYLRPKGQAYFESGCS